jgi:hypothetical protein
MSRQIKGVRLNASDFYPTPPWCYENLDIDWKQFTSAHEPGKGDGRIVDFLSAKMNSLATVSYTEIMEGLDFFLWDESADLILTNPPFSMALEFIKHSIPRCNTCIMLLRLNYLGSITRHQFWKENSPTALFVLSKRPSFTGSGTDATDYAWFVWDKTDRIPKGIHFVDVPSKEASAKANQLAKDALESYNEIIKEQT